MECAALLAARARPEQLRQTRCPDTLLAPPQDKIEDLQSKLAAVQEQRVQLRRRSHMLATALQLRKEELRKLCERQAQVTRFRHHHSDS
jgi:hypothetical protein